MEQTIRVRILITRRDPIAPRLWMIVRQDLSRQLTEYFSYQPDMGIDQGAVTVIHTPVTAAVARVGLHAPAFAQAVGNMLRAYDLPHRFTVQVAILRLTAAGSREVMVALKQRPELVPKHEHIMLVEQAEEHVNPGADHHA